MNNTDKQLFIYYSYLSNIGSFLLNCAPHFVRNIVYKILLRKMGTGTIIDYHVYMRYFKNIEIGSNVVINRGCQLYTTYKLKKKIIIKDNVTISPNTKLYGAAHDYNSQPMLDTAEDITIEENCWICADVTILQGVTIGENSVIGAKSVVCSNIPKNSIAVGNPARVIKERFTS